MERSCSSCGTALVAGARFCAGCGLAVAAAGCRACGAPAATGRFCASCGAPTAGAEDPPPPTTAVRLPPRVAERRVATVLFGDLVGSTSYAETADAEDVRELLARCAVESRRVLTRYGGTVEKFIGDAVMAVWGTRDGHEDDAERAVRAGLDLVDAVAAVGESAGVDGLQLRVGIVTGEVAVTLAASGEGLVAGDTVNTAARVQSVAAPGAVWVDDATRERTAAAVAFADEGEHALRGKTRPLRLWRARGVVAAVGGAQRVDGLEAPFRGRHRELRLVKELFHATEEDSRSRIVVVTGVAGTGKSRLGWEFEKHTDGISDSVWWHRGRCLSYGEGVAFWALAEAVKRRLGCAEDTTAAVVKARLGQWLAAVVADPEERDWLQPRMDVLLGTGSAPAERAELFAAWTAFLGHVSGGGGVGAAGQPGGPGPVVLLLEDIHHADEGLLDFCEHALDTAAFPLFVLALGRPEVLDRRPSLGHGPRRTTVHLGPLPPGQMGALVDGLVEGLPLGFREALVARAEGIPLSAVETVRALIDRDLVVPREGRYTLVSGVSAADLAGVAAPATLQAIVAGRLDALAPEERALVQDAAVLGTTVTLAGLTAVDPHRPDLARLVTALVRKEVLEPEAVPRGGPARWRFVQSVVRQVAYDTLARRDRKERHLAVAAHLAGQPDPGGDLAAVAAQHHLDALCACQPEDPDRDGLRAAAAALLEQAGVRALALGSPAESLRHLRAALLLHDEAGALARIEAEAARAALLAGEPHAAVEHAGRATAGWSALGDRAAAGSAAEVHARALLTLQDIPAAVALLTPHHAALRDDPDAEPVLLGIVATLGRLHHYRGDLDEARTFTEQALRLAEAHQDVPRLVTALSDQGILWISSGAATAGSALLERAVELARRRHLPAPGAQALVNLAAFQMGRDVRASLAAAREGRALAKQVGNRRLASFATQNLALGLWLTGDWVSLREELADPARTGGDVIGEVVGHAVAGWLAAATATPPPDPPAALAAGLDSEDTMVRAWSHAALLTDLAASGSGLADGAEQVHERARLSASALRYFVDASGLEDDFAHHWPPAVEAALAAGDVEAAAALAALVGGARPGLVTPLLAAELLRLSALVEAARGGPGPEPEAHLRAAVAALDEVGAPFPAARARLALARLLLARGARTEAEVEASAAAGAFAALGATPWLAQAADLVPGGGGGERVTVGAASVGAEPVR